MGERFFTDKLVLRWLEVLDVWSLDSATPFPSAYPVHASGSPYGLDTQTVIPVAAMACTARGNHSILSKLALLEGAGAWRRLP